MVSGTDARALLSSDVLRSANTLPAPLAPELLSAAVDLPAPPSFEQPSAAAAGASSSASSSGQASATTEKKVPKWLKLGSEFADFSAARRAHSRDANPPHQEK